MTRPSILLNPALRTQPVQALRTLVAALAVAVGLAACGGGGADAPPGSTPVLGGTGTVLSGAVIDGYIKGAKICLDSNDNGACDAGEPFATTGTGGAFTITVPAGTDVTGKHLVAEVPVGAIDEDTPGTPIAAAMKLLAPATTPAVVSPLTTMVSTNMKDDKTLSVALAQAKAVTDLGLPSGYDFGKDYVKTADTSAHDKAKTLAGVLTTTVGSGAADTAKLKTALAAGKTALAANGSGSGSGSGGTSTSALVTFDEATAPTLIDFGTNGAGASIVTDPAGGSNKVLKVFKYTGSEQWAGTTVAKLNINPTGADNSGFNAVTAIPFTATAKTMTMRVYSPAVGVRIRLKVENASNNGISCETDAVSTVAGAWETLTFDFSNPGKAPPVTGGPTAALDVSKTYNKVSIFADFGLGNGGTGPLPANRTYYFDDLTFVPASSGTGTGTGTTPTTTALTVVRANATGSPAYDKTNGKALPGNYATGVYSANAGEASWWGGNYDEQIQAGYGFSKTNTAQWGFGIYIANGGTGWDIASMDNYSFTLGTNTECVGVCKVTVRMVSKVDAACVADAKVTLTSADITTAYTVPLTGFTVKGCATNTMTAFKAGKVSELHFQLLREDMQFTTSGDPSLYPNGLGLGGNVKFSPADAAAPSTKTTIVRANAAGTPAFDKTNGKALPANYATGVYSANAGEASWWGGNYDEQIQAGYGFSKTNTAQWGFGIYIANGGTGWDISAASNYRFTLGSNTECVGVCKVTVRMVSKVDSACVADAKVTLTSADITTAYTVPLTGFTVKGCATNTMTAFKAGKVAELHFQLLRDDMQFTTSGDPSLYPNGLGVGGNIYFD